MHRGCMQTGTECALAVRSEDFTAPYKTDHQRSSCVIPAPAGIQLLSETALNSGRKDAREPPECTGNACKHALIALAVRSEDFTAPYKRDLQRSNCVIPAHAGIQSLSETALNSVQTDARGPPGMHRECMQTGTDCALAVRSEDFTAPYKTDHQRSSCVIPSHAGIQWLSETDPNSVQTDAREPSECTPVALKRAQYVH